MLYNVKKYECIDMDSSYDVIDYIRRNRLITKARQMAQENDNDDLDDYIDWMDYDEKTEFIKTLLSNSKKDRIVFHDDCLLFIVDIDVKIEDWKTFIGG